ncbi:MAG: Crp/Fnr family transcriptional regulator [Paludibacteraceae bacterium]|nr:Crp/Fnr family transcriptional regulator [Paludibacteraceae bacterium]
MSIYDSLLQIPLFKGLSIETFNDIIEKYKFEFLSYDKGSTIITAGEECNCFKFVISGSVRSEFTNEKIKIKLSETISAPNDIISNYALGNNVFPVSVFAENDNTGILVVDKQDFLSIMQEQRVVMLNYLILLSRKSQIPYEAYNQIATDNIRAKFALWILYFTNYNSSNISIKAKFRDLYLFFGAQRGALNSVLEEMKELGIIEYSLKEIQILDRKELMRYYREVCER